MITTAGWLAIAYHVASRLAYVVGVGTALTLEKRRRRFTRVGGVEAGYQRFRRFAATVMNNDAFSFALVCWVTRDSFRPGVSRWVLVVSGIALILLGAGVKLWSRATLGSHGYHWRDFFDPEPAAPATPTGPYRFLKNPMYTVGYGHAYGIALVLASLPGLVLAAFDQLAILGFYKLVEQPHFEQLTPRIR